MRLPVIITLTAACAAVVASTAPAGAGAVNQTFTVPSSGSFTITGHGYGHGHGMSQYGAEGAARKGLDHKAILKFYYPGTTLDTVGGLIRVRISSDTTRDVVVLPSAGLKVNDLGSDKSYPLPTTDGITQWRLDVDANGRTVVDYKRSTWKRYEPGGRSTLVGDGSFTNSARLLSLVTSSGTKKFRGSLRASSPSAGSRDRDTVNVLSVNNYVKGVVPAEMPATWSPEAVQAQSVAARTYGLWSRQSRIDKSWQICDTTSCQVYKGYSGEHPASNNAVDATAGQILTYSGKPAFTQFSSSSGGWTSKGSVPYLVGKADPYDDWSGNHVHDWSVKVSESTLERRFPAIGDLKKLQVTSREGGGEWGGRVTSLKLIGGAGTRTISGTDLRSIYGLRSHWVSFK